ncbi:MAG: DUF5131 family protein [Myxococcales bacterium]|nr:DUF5131 family protein [Myxococcales bacterium]
MAHGSSIEWTESTWNPVTGCTKVSPGCKFAALDAELLWAPNIWMGVSVESSSHVGRIDELRRARAHVRFLSLEPLLGQLPDLDLRGIHWVIVGGESGPKARPMGAAWALDIRDQSRSAGVPFFFKQWGGKNKKRAGRLLEGRTWDEIPARPAPRARRGAAAVRSLPVVT